MRTDECELAWRQHQPDLDSMISRLPELGAAIATAYCELAKDYSLERLDLLMMKHEGVVQSFVLMRQMSVKKDNLGCDSD